uniref:SSSGP-1E1 n=1 Tax=Mayetiola destructor TaxID=39758 RepID=D1MLP3_MAYDE|nr:SSSGP-1E1 [Mayetiola destructor]
MSKFFLAFAVIAVCLVAAQAVQEPQASLPQPHSAPASLPQPHSAPLHQPAPQTVHSSSASLRWDQLAQPAGGYRGMPTRTEPPKTRGDGSSTTTIAKKCRHGNAPSAVAAPYTNQHSLGEYSVEDDEDWYDALDENLESLPRNVNGHHEAAKPPNTGKHQATGSSKPHGQAKHRK